MTITFDTQDILDHQDILSIAKETVKEEIQRYLRNDNMKSEENIQRLISNHAGQWLFDELHSIIPDYKEQLRTEIIKTIQEKSFDFYVWRRKDIWHSEDSFAWKIVLEEMKKAESIIRDNVKSAISNFNYDLTVKEAIGKVTEEICYNFGKLSDLLFQNT